MVAGDRAEFALLLTQINRVVIRPVELSPEFIHFYCIALQDLSLDQIRLNAGRYAREVGNLRFPTIAELAGNIGDPAVEAYQVFGILEKYASNFVRPYMTESKILETMKASGDDHYYPLLKQWGREIAEASTDGKSTVRAQFVKYFHGWRQKEGAKLLKPIDMRRLPKPGG